MTRRAGSLRLRLLAATLVTLLVALAGSHLLLSSLFREHVLGQFDATLVQQLDQLAARLEPDAQGQPRIDPRTLSDPRWEKPYSGLYWQVDRLAGDGAAQAAVLRSRSLWDTQLALRDDTLADGVLHTHQHAGPRGETLRVVERALRFADPPQGRWRVAVAADTAAVAAAVAQFNGVLAWSLAALGLLLALAALAQVGVGLSPLTHLQRALQRVRAGQSQRLEGAFPAELQPLVEDFNGVLDRNAEVVARARTQAGNLAHALKTPLAVLDNAAHQSSGQDLRALVGEQVRVAQRHIDWHLARSRVAATRHLPGQRTPVRSVVEPLVRVMGKLHAARALALTVDVQPEDCAFAGEEQDLQEMLGNLLDNACRSAQSAVRVQARCEGDLLHIVVEDDGPGIAPEARAAVLQRGVRLDESTPGSGLGLAIVLDLAQLYGGQLALEEGASGGLRARLVLPGSFIHADMSRSP